MTPYSLEKISPLAALGYECKNWENPGVVKPTATSIKRKPGTSATQSQKYQVGGVPVGGDKLDVADLKHWNVFKTESKKSKKCFNIPKNQSESRRWKGSSELLFRTTKLSLRVFYERN